VTSPFWSSAHHQAVICSKTLPHLHRSLIWKNLYQIHACKAHIYIYVEDPPPSALQRASVSSCMCPTCLHKVPIASVAMPDDKLDVYESRFENISAVQASTCSLTFRRICSSLMRLYGVPRATSTLDPLSTRSKTDL
jgi:hypothetical protein